MAAHAYPHIVFATDAQTLPRAELESLLTELFGGADPTPQVTHGPLQVELRLGDYVFTFWYDDDAEGLGGRYADYAPPLKRRRVSRCTTMIDLSGAADPDREHAGAARRLTDALAARSGVYVFSEGSKSFVGLDEHDPFADVPAPAPELADDDIPDISDTPDTPDTPDAVAMPAPTTTPREPEAVAPEAVAPEPVPTREPAVASEPAVALEPAAAPEPARAAEPAASSAADTAAGGRDAAASDVFVSDDADRLLPRVVDDPEPTSEAGVARSADPAPSDAESDVPSPRSAPGAESEQTPQSPAAQPEPTEEEPQGGFFKRLFGRGRR